MMLRNLLLTWFIVKLRCFPSFMVLVPWRRRVGKQTPTAPEVQLRDVVWSDESSFIHENTSICLGFALSRNCLFFIHLRLGACRVLP